MIAFTAMIMCSHEYVLCRPIKKQKGISHTYYCNQLIKIPQKVFLNDSCIRFHNMKQIEHVRVKHITEERNPLTVGLESMSTEGRKDQLMFRGRVCRPWLGNKWARTGESPAWWTERGYGGERGKWGEGWGWFPVRGTRADIRLSSGKVCCFSSKELAKLKKIVKYTYCWFS